ncbi:Bacterial alpha-L-rhamnosidase [Paenibacillus sp. LMG 31461]|uniref:Bacterial alpha-L-rhamnosidase n=1 Tax=Paenibacillus plantarum TaxID=2654975 RepID=A0ABX1X3G7_9BACL|nr:alpha-L-rhamnosidase N-terminal domain-containing protein [Paenibacillus plantarum]NOU62844.1 Bacterial alpha-L-rhamnosidase [Paenibacillus plantarum]
MNQIWKSKWIWIDTPEYTPNVYVEARTVFPLSVDFQSATLRISANQEYKLFINGRLIGSGPSPSDNAWKYFDTYNVLDALQKGDNCIAVLAYNFGDRQIVTQQRQGPGGLIAQLDIRTDDGNMSILTDDSWKCRRSPRWVHKVSRMHSWSGYKEIYLADKEDSWEMADYDDSSWEKAKVMAKVNDPDSAWPRLIPREIPFLSRKEIKPNSVLRTEDNNGLLNGAEQLVEGMKGSMLLDASVPGSLPGVVFDFGAVTVGYPVIEVIAPEGGVLQLSYGESLEIVQLDTFKLKKGVNRLSPFGRRAFRYLQISVQATPASIYIENFHVESVRYPFMQGGSFESSDMLLNRIWDIGRYTTSVNSQDHLEDCPYREQALWVVDAVVMAKVIFQTFGDTALVRKCLLQGARIQNEDGSIPGTGPERNSFLLPDFNAYWLLGVHDYWRYSGDDKILSELNAPIRRLIEWFINQEDENGLFARADRDGWWCFVDWADYIDKRDRVTAISCLQHKVLRSAADMAVALGDTSFAEECNVRAERLRTSIRNLLWNSDKELFADCLTDSGLSDSFTYQTNFIAIWSGIMTEDEADNFINNVFIKGQCPELKGAFFYHIVLEVLFSRGDVKMALDIIRSFWGEMVARGATTWWETFDPSSPHCTIPSPYQGNTPTYLADSIPVSHCHGWGASPTYLLTERILGIDVSGISSGEFGFQPALGDLDWAKGMVPTAYGSIHAKFMRETDGVVDLVIEYPAALSIRPSVTIEQTVMEHIGEVVVLRGKMAL